MMKKFLATILALVYLSSAIGQAHLPGSINVLISWVIKSCTYCGTDKSSGSYSDKETNSCCEAGQKQLKHSDQHVGKASIHPKRPCSQAVTPVLPDYGFAYVSPWSEAHPVTNAPPRTAPVSLHILHCVFRL